MFVKHFNYIKLLPNSECIQKHMLPESLKNFSLVPVIFSLYCKKQSLKYFTIPAYKYREGCMASGERLLPTSIAHILITLI